MAEYFKPVYSDELLHYQVKGAKWGVRRWQNLDGSLTPEGRIHYGIGPARDKDPDLVDPVGKAKADIERLNDYDDQWYAAYRNINRYGKEAKSRRKFLESRKTYNERISDAQKRLDLATNAERIYSEKRQEAFEIAQARFEKYMQISDELSSDLSWIDMQMYLETGEAGSKQTYIDRDEMESLWSELEDAVDTYWYNGLMNHDRALNANDEYRDKFEMNDSPRGKEAAREQTAKFALRNVKSPKNITKFTDTLSSGGSIASSSATRKILDSIDTGDLVKKYKAGSSKGDEEAEAMALDIAKQLLGSSANAITDKANNRSAAAVVSRYLTEKALTEAYKDDPDVLDNLWRTNAYYPDSGKALDDWEKRNGQKWR